MNAAGNPAKACLAPTPAMDRGVAHVRQCGGCGVLIYVPLPPGSQELGECPACGRNEWWDQRLPVGPFGVSREER